jgi:SAM-dependent methyltransferase
MGDSLPTAEADNAFIVERGISMDLRAVSSGLRLGKDGIWWGPDALPVSYPDDGHDVLAQVEDASFWFRHRNRCIEAAVRRQPPPGGGPIFDVGGGNGFVSAGLRAAGFDVVLVEPGPQGALNARRRGLDTVVCATTDSAGFGPASLPAIGLFDVIEHIEDDRGFLAAMQGLLVAGGRLYATVPAYQGLWSHEDVAAGHYRRYTLAQIGQRLVQAGLRLDYASYFFRPLPLPIALLRALPYRLGLGSGGRPGGAQKVARDHAAQPGSKKAGLIERLLASEVEQIRAGRSMRFGGSCLLVASKI